MFLLSLLKKKYREFKFSRLNSFCKIHPSAINLGINLRLDKPTDKVYLSIGSECISAGDFVFESEDGYISIGNHTYIGGGTFISHSKIEIGDNVTIAWGGFVYDHDSHSLNFMQRRKDIDDGIECIRVNKEIVFSKI